MYRAGLWLFCPRDYLGFCSLTISIHLSQRKPFIKRLPAAHCHTVWSPSCSKLAVEMMLPPQASPRLFCRQVCWTPRDVSSAHCTDCFMSDKGIICVMVQPVWFSSDAFLEDSWRGFRCQGRILDFIPVSIARYETACVNC